MTTKSESDLPRKSDPCDPWPVVAYAVRSAIKCGADRFVVCDRKFHYMEVAPPPICSHWKADADGNVFAHMGGMDVTTYAYEPVNEGR